jgi:hypothetical protein
MAKTVVVSALLFVTFLYGCPSWACEAFCGGDTWCSGTYCECLGRGEPHCTGDAMALRTNEEYVKYLRTWNLPGLNIVANAATELMEATNANDLAAYQRAMRKHIKAVAALSKTERGIYSEFETAPRESMNRER